MTRLLAICLLALPLAGCGTVSAGLTGVVVGSALTTAAYEGPQPYYSPPYYRHRHYWRRHWGY